MIKSPEQQAVNLVNDVARELGWKTLSEKPVVARDKVLGGLQNHFPEGANWRYYQAKNKRNRKVLFCYSVHRNANGMFCSWIYKPRSGNAPHRLTDFMEFKRKKDAIARAQKRAQAFLDGKAKRRLGKPLLGEEV